MSPPRRFDEQFRDLLNVCLEGGHSNIEIALNKDSTFAGGQIHPVKQLGRGGPVLDESGAAIRKLKELSTADFGANAPKIVDDGTVLAK